MRRRIALLGVFAVLFQAVLLGWHHHPGHFAVDGQWPALSSADRTGPLVPATAEDECELCAALHYLTAAPGEFILAPSPVPATVPPAPALTAWVDSSRAFPFQARAPPSA